MLKILYVARINNFHIFLIDFSLDSKHVILSCLDELLGLQYMFEKLGMYSFQFNLNRNNISPIDLDMF